MARLKTATVRSCLAAASAALTTVAFLGISGQFVADQAAGPDVGQNLRLANGNAAGSAENTSDEATSLRAAQETGEPVQVTSLTSETTEVFALPGGQFRAEIAMGMQRFRRGAEWVKVDLTLRAAPDGSIAPVAHPNDLRISGQRGAGEHELAAVGVDGDRVAMGWSGHLPTPLLDGNRAIYVDARPGVDLVVEATRTGFEQFLVVKTREAGTQVEEVTFPFSGPGVGGFRRGGDGSVTLTDEVGKQTAHIPAPLMWDAKKKPITGAPADQKPVHTDVAERGDDAVDLIMVPDRDWLNDPATAYPVTIDPTVSPLTTTFDTYVRETVTTDQNGEPDLQIGLLNTSPPTLTRSFLTWDTTVLAGKQINSATVSFWNFWSHTCAATSWEIWTTAPSTYTTTFTNQPAWDAVGPDATSTATLGGATCGDGWATIDGKTFFQRAATANKTRAGMGVRATDETAIAGFKQFRSREGANSAEDPKATVTYNSWPTVTSRSTVPATSCITGASRPLLNTLTPQLKATVSDADGTAMTVTFEWWALDGSAAIGSTAFTGVATGGTATATVPAGAFTEGGSYKWRVKASDGVAGSDLWTSFCEMTVYVIAPPVPGCTGGVQNDFNGDGVADVAIADPEADVNGQDAAGAVHIFDGVTSTTTTITQDDAQVPGTSEAGDRFGHTVNVTDANRDGCADLAIGSPYEDNGSIVDAGEVQILFGSPAGLGKSSTAPALLYNQGVDGVPGTQVRDDLFGFSLASGRTAAGEPFLVIGAPGENVSGKFNAGTVTYLRGSTKIAFDQTSIGNLSGGVEQDDRGGWALAATPYHFAVAYPGENGSTSTAGAFSGRVCVFNHTITSGLPGTVGCVDQDSSGVSDAMETGDTFGKSIAMAPYWPTGDSILAVGVPGEDADGGADVGMVHQFRVSGTIISQLSAIDQNTASIADASEPGDLFGENVLLVNTSPSVVPTAQTLQIAVGAPGEDSGTTIDSGNLHVFAAGTATPTSDTLVERAAGKLPGAPANRELLGFGGGTSSTHLYVSSPYVNHAVWALPWSALATGAATPSKTWQPGVNGVPADAVAFGEQAG
ncbi:hypothetical protein [Micromonospora sp. NBRC 101691]|uniref:hypothetical protein n=1 Tax=Micromonospora sp. NBRC 101691 TaxID=3032198 RepID=UPI0024A11932|nr:hypothetical protein [Micromonospora sp. NBRC 101691]GLY23727.1 hypothetical protein Misp04_34590 [Micromonospora sp. NBRC 101691]